MSRSGRAPGPFARSEEKGAPLNLDLELDTMLCGQFVSDIGMEISAVAGTVDFDCVGKLAILWRHEGLGATLAGIGRVANW